MNKELTTEILAKSILDEDTRIRETDSDFFKIICVSPEFMEHLKKLAEGEKK